MSLTTAPTGTAAPDATARTARRRVQTAVALTALSCVPSVAWPDDAASKLALAALQVLAAAIVVPALVRHAHDRAPRPVPFTRRRL